MTRAFIAVVPTAVVLESVSERVASLSMPPGARVAPREQWHMTVQFLGDEADTDAVAAAFATEPLSLGAGELQLGGGVVFGNPRRARVLALGLRAGGEWMQLVAAQVADRLARLGYARDPQEQFVPHLTLARFRVPADLRAARDALGPEPVGPLWSVSEVVLFASTLRPEGAQHVVQAHLPVVHGAR